MARKRAKPSGTSTPTQGADDVHWHSIKDHPSLVYRSGMTDRIAAMLRTGGVLPRANPPVGRHVRNWRSSCCPIAETPGHFLDWVTFRLSCIEAMEPLISTRDSADSFFGTDDYSNDVRDAFLAARLLEDHHGFPSFNKEQPKGHVAVDLVQARQLLRALRAWLRQEMPPDGDGESGGPRQPVCESKAVKLFGPGEQPEVNGKRKTTLTKARYDAIKALIEAGENGLTKDELPKRSKHTDAVNSLKTLAKKDRDWKRVLQFAGEPGKRHRIK